MAARRRTNLVAGLVLGLAAGALLIAASAPLTSAADTDPSAFTPAAPAPAIHAALQANLKIVRDWLDEKDYPSAAQTAQGLVTLAQLYSYQSAQPRWRERTTALREAFLKLGTTARSKDGPSCAKMAQECAAILDELVKSAPMGDKVVEKNFKAFGSTKTWMLLMDGTYVDAKSVKSAKELELLAYAIAEEANVVRYLRSDGRWRQMSQDVQAAALATVVKAQGNDLAAAKKELKTVYQRCEACHQGTKK